MPAVITVPPTLDSQTVEQLLDQLAAIGPNSPLVVDASGSLFACPFGQLTILAIGRGRNYRPILIPPADPDRLRYWIRTGLTREALRLYDVPGPVPEPAPHQQSSVLLSITRLGPSHQNANVTDQLQTVLDLTLRDSARNAESLARAIVLTCVESVQKSGEIGWAMAQNYTLKGTRQRMTQFAFACPRGDGWRAEGGTEAVRELAQSIRLADGKLAVRSGTSCWGVIPEWDRATSRPARLSPMPGMVLEIELRSSLRL